MRPIKYRCLNKKTNEITNDIFSINLAHNEVVIWKEIYEEGQSHINYEVLFGFKDEFELMQFTGLYDSKENPIYEGDIIKRTYKDKTFCIFPVELSIYEDDEQYSTYEHCGWNYNGRSLVDALNQIEVIGNIHETPELLETKP